jgi:hypothetical protein
VLVRKAENELKVAAPVQWARDDLGDGLVRRDAVAGPGFDRASGDLGRVLLRVRVWRTAARLLPVSDSGHAAVRRDGAALVARGHGYDHPEYPHSFFAQRAL